MLSPCCTHTQKTQHQFCDECISSWLRRSTECPVCKDSVIRSAGVSEAEALRIAAEAAGGALLAAEAQRRRQIDGRDDAAPAAAGWAGAALGTRARDLELAPPPQQQHPRQQTQQQQHRQQYPPHPQHPQQQQQRPPPSA